jgi:hypothetical protein
MTSEVIRGTPTSHSIYFRSHSPHFDPISPSPKAKNGIANSRQFGKSFADGFGVAFAFAYLSF